MFNFEFQVGSLITEKELKLRQAMSIMGLYESAYWLSWLTWETVLTLLSSIFSILFGMMFQFDFFLHNSFAVLFLVVTAFGFPYGNSFSKGYQVIWSIFPPNLLAQALDLLGRSTATPQDEGISWSKRADCPPKDLNCAVTIDGIYKWLVSTFFVWLLLAIYFDNIISNSNGVRKPLFYFLKSSYWMGKGGNKVEEGSLCSCTSSIPPLDDATADDEDVLAEESIVKQQASENVLDPSVAVQVCGLTKTYPGTTKLAGCCKCERSLPYHAVKGIWVNFAKDQLFCLLGPNGAGKTTVINCLIGITPVTSGDAMIYGYSIRSAVGMSSIRRLIGVCPQFDILWDALTGEEHLHLFANIKGLSPASIKSVVEKSLAEVKLTEATKVRVGSYSGGMKRRLSVAIALIGDPKLVILDEPLHPYSLGSISQTTGMDPITRRHVWDIIEDAKKGRAIVLTTHSMEEADILGDRIAIMAKGKLRCIGTSIRLKSRFGTGYITTVSFTGTNAGQSPGAHGNGITREPQYELVKQFFKYHLDVEPKEENKAFLTFIIPHEKEELLTGFFAELQEREIELGISDIQLGLTTLEEVFLNIAKKAELEDASADGNLVTLNLESGASVQIPRGARFIGIPGTESADNPRGTMVEVYWQQDDSGLLCISGCSAEMPVPPNVEPMTMPSSSSRRLFSRSSSSLIRGFVIDPNQIET
ncbi:ATP-binding cassette sub- A member 2 [Asimina triloba]